MTTHGATVARVLDRSVVTRRWLLAGAVALLGAIDIASAILSHPPDRLVAVRHIVPTEVLDTSRTFTLLAGALLLVTAWGLRRGKRRAFVTALLLCAISVPVNVLKALDVEEATVATALMFALGVSGDAFRVRSRELSLRRIRLGFVWGVLALAVWVVLGAWLLELAFGPALPARRVFAELAHRMFGIGPAVPAGHEHLPHPAHRVFEWYLRSLPLLGLTLVVGAAVLALRPARHRRRHREEAGRVAALLESYGDGSVSPFALASDSDFFFSANRRAVVPYHFESDTLLGIGDPLGPPDELPSLLDGFERYCHDSDWEPALFQASAARLPLYTGRGWRALHIGEDPLLELDQFTLEGSAVGDVRRMSRKATEQGLEIHHFRPGENPFDPHDDTRGWLPELRNVSNQWLRGRHGGEKGFCMGRFDPAALPHVWLAVAWNAKTSRIEGFVTWLRVPARRGWVLDLMRRRSDAMNGTMELLVVRSAEHARERGDTSLSLGLSALVRVDRPDDASVPADTREVARVREFLLDHLSRFYDFRGLFHWKSKFAPTFEPRYLVYASPTAISRVALALVRAQSPGGFGEVMKTLGRGRESRRVTAPAQPTS